MPPLSSNTTTGATPEKETEAQNTKISKTPVEDNIDTDVMLVSAFTPVGASFSLSCWSSSQGDDNGSPIISPSPSTPSPVNYKWSDDDSWSDYSDGGDSSENDASDYDDGASDDGDEISYQSGEKKSRKSPQEVMNLPQRLFFTTPKDWSDSSDDDESLNDSDDDVDDVTSAHGEPQDTSRRVSFGEDPKVHVFIKPSLEYWGDLYWSCHELQKIMDEHRMEKDGCEEDEAAGELC